MRNYREFIAETSELSPLDLYYYRFESEAVLEAPRIIRIEML